MRRTRVLAAATAAVLAGAVVLIPATAAHALASGAGWSGSWSYYLDDNYTFNATLPGVSVVGYAIDSGGTRLAGVSLEDTALDGRCAHVLMRTTSNGQFVTIGERIVCDGAPYVSFATPWFTGHHKITLSSVEPELAGVHKSFNLDIPSSVDDPGLRRAGTGASWAYYTDDAYQVTLERPGTRVVAFGTRQSFDTRSFTGTLVHTGSVDTCFRASVTDFGTFDDARACTAGATDSLSVWRLRGNLHVSVCQTDRSGRCVLTVVPEPT